MAHPLVTGNVEPTALAKELGFTQHEENVLKVKVNRDLYGGDHWRGGLGYIGAPPDPLDPNAGELWARLRRSFASQNVIKEVTDRLVGCVLGNVPDYGFTVRRPRRRVPKMIPDPAFTPDPLKPDAAAPMIPDPSGDTELEPLSEEEEKLIERAAAATEIFYTSKKPLRWLKRLFRKRLLQNRAYLRLHVPAKFRAGGRVSAKDLNAAVERIFITEPEAEDAVRLIDEETQDPLSIYRYKRGEKAQVFELCFTDDAGRTYVATIEQTVPVAGVDVRAPVGLLPASPFGRAAEAAAEGRLLANIPPDNISDPVDLAGHLTVFEMSGEPLINEQIRSQNASLNLNLTMANHVTVESGFREMAVTNVEMETVKIRDDRAPGGFREVPRRLKRGGGVFHNFMSVSLGTDVRSGVEELAPTEIQAFDPVSLDTFETGHGMFRRNILSEVHQLWALITGDAAPSGESRIQAMADFVIFALDFQEEVEDAGTWLFECFLYMAAALAGEPGAFSSLRVNFKTRLYLGRLTPAEKTLLMSEVEKRLRSKENYMLIAGDISDPREEKTRIEREEAESVEGQRARVNLEADRRALEGGGVNDE